MQLRYYVPFKAQEAVSAEYALKEKLINIEGVAIDTSVNANKWQVPPEDLDAVAESLIGAQLRVDHAESALMIVGKVTDAKRVGDKVFFKAEVGEEKLVEKILREYVKYVSIQVDSDNVECSKCLRPTRREGMLVHLCPGAWEVVHKPRVREISIVATPAYKTTEFQPVGFYAAMNDAQWDALLKGVENSQLSRDNIDVGSRQEMPQEPETKIGEMEKVKPEMSEKDREASPPKEGLKAQAVVNVGPEEKPAKPIEYETLIKQLTDLKKQIGELPAAAEEVGELKKKVAELEAELAKKATKRALSRKISELSKQLAEEVEETAKPPVEKGVEGGEAEAKRPSGKGIVAVDEISRDMLGNYDWFRDLLKAHRKLTGFQA